MVGSIGLMMILLSSTALRDITAGRGYTIYDQCEDCVGRIVRYETGEILRDYGFC